MNKIKLYWSLLLVYLIGLYSMWSYALDIWFPGQWWQKEVNIKYQHVAGNKVNESYLMKILNLVNEYLWFFVGFVCLLMLLYAGYNIITAQGDKKQISKSYDLIIATMVAIFIAVLSYAVVKVLVNLF